MHEGTDASMQACMHALRPNTRTVHFLHVHFHHTCSTSTPHINYARIEFTLHLHHICFFLFALQLGYTYLPFALHLHAMCITCASHFAVTLRLNYIYLHLLYAAFAQHVHCISLTLHLQVECIRLTFGLHLSLHYVYITSTLHCICIRVCSCVAFNCGIQLH